MFNKILSIALSIASFLFIFIGFTKTSSAQVLVDRQEGGYLYRRLYTLNAGDSILFETDGCTGSEDTVMYLLEGTNGAVTTRAWADDSYGLGLCSRINFTNSSGSTKTYTLVIVSFSGTTTGFADLWVSRNGAPPGRDETNMHFGGARNNDAPWASTSYILTKPLRPISGEGSGGPNGRGIEDTFLIAINSVPGQTSYIDDDSGLTLHSTIVTSTGCSGTGVCHILAGGYANSYTGNISVWRRDITLTSMTDTDGDFVPNDIETYYGTSTTSNDTDQDGIEDYAELVGMAFGTTYYNDGNSLILPYYDTSPTQQDMYWEIDYMVHPTDSSDSHQPNSNLISDMVGIYQTDSTFTGRSIRPHIEVSQDVGHYNGINYEDCVTPTSNRINFYDIKNNPAFFDQKRLTVFHYIIAAHAVYYPPDCTLQGITGKAEIYGNDVTIALAGQETMLTQRGTYVHEVGHNFGFSHEYNDFPLDNTKNSCIHTSVMNYRYQVGGWGTTAVTPSLRRYSYSRGTCDAAILDTDCPNTCTTFMGKQCVPANEVTPKANRCPTNMSGDHVGLGDCDCDESEWGSLQLGWVKQPAQLEGYVDGANPNGGINSRSPSVLGNETGLARRRWEIARNKVRKLFNRGLREGVDFTVDYDRGKVYARH